MSRVNWLAAFVGLAFVVAGGYVADIGWRYPPVVLLVSIGYAINYEAMQDV